MRTHEKNIHKTINILIGIIAFLLFTVGGLLMTIRIFFGQYLNSFSEIFAFLSSFILMGFLSILPLLAIFALIAQTLGVQNIYDHAYNDGSRDKYHELKDNQL